VALHPEVTMRVGVNVARSVEEAEKQARGESVRAEEAEEEAVDVAALLDPEAAPQPEV
jgi:large subunit ribosomal protein L9